MRLCRHLSHVVRRRAALQASSSQHRSGPAEEPNRDSPNLCSVITTALIPCGYWATGMCGRVPVHHHEEHGGYFHMLMIHLPLNKQAATALLCLQIIYVAQLFPRSCTGEYRSTITEGTDRQPSVITISHYSGDEDDPPWQHDDDSAVAAAAAAARSDIGRDGPPDITGSLPHPPLPCMYSQNSLSACQRAQGPNVRLSRLFAEQICHKCTSGDCFLQECSLNGF